MLISIIVPVYKVEDYLAQCIDSILQQTFKDFELILVDDGSPDRCGAICDEYAKKDARIIVFHTVNQGVAAARSFGLSHTNGDYISFIDGDDWIEETMLKSLITTMLDKEADITACLCAEEYLNASIILRQAPHQTLNSQEALIELLYQQFMTAGLCNKLIKKDLFKNVEMCSGLKIGEDFLVTYQLICACHSFAFSQKVGYHYRQRVSSAMYLSSTEERKKFLDKLKVIMNDLPAGEADIRLAVVHCYTNTALAAMTTCNEKDYRAMRDLIIEYDRQLCADARAALFFKFKIKFSKAGRFTYQMCSYIFKRIQRKKKPCFA